MKAFISYRHTGEKTEFLEELITKVSAGLTTANVEPYSTFYDQAEFKRNSMTAKDVMRHAFQEIDASDLLFVVQTSELKSEGMLIEVGYCIAKGVPVVVAIQDTVQNTYLPDMGQGTFRWHDLDDLQAKISAYDFSNLKK